MKRSIALLAALLLTSIARMQAVDFVIADASRSIKPAPIVVFKDAPPRTRDAAATLAEYIEKQWDEHPPHHPCR